MLESECDFENAKPRMCHFTKGKWPTGNGAQVRVLNNNIYIVTITFKCFFKGSARFWVILRGSGWFWFWVVLGGSG